MQYQICECCGKAKRPKQESKRFPSNTLLSHTLLCQPHGEKRVKANGYKDPDKVYSSEANIYGKYNPTASTSYNEEGFETVAAYDCSEDCPVRLLDEQSGVRKTGGGIKTKSGSNVGNGITLNTYKIHVGSEHVEPNEGGASRYYQCFPPDDMPPFTYHPKASRRERNEGCEALPVKMLDSSVQPDSVNFGTMKAGGSGKPVNGTGLPLPRTNGHPTVKPLSLLKYLITMITPPNGIVLDMFAGSGSTGVACVQNGFRYILIEQEQEYIDIIHARLAHAHKAMPVQEQEYECVPECPVRILGEQSGERKSGGKAGKRYQHKTERADNAISFVTNTIGNNCGRSISDTGTAARFFKTFPPEPSLWDTAEEAL